MTRFPVFPTASSAVHRRTALVVAQSGTHEELVARWAGSGPGPRDLRHLNCRARNATRRRAARFGHEHGRSMPGEEAHCWAASRARRRAVRDVKRSTRRWVAGWSSGRSRAGRAAGQVPRSTRLEAPQLPGTIARRRGLEGRGERRALVMSMGGACPTKRLTAGPRRELAAAPFGTSNARRSGGWRSSRSRAGRAAGQEPRLPTGPRHLRHLDCRASSSIARWRVQESCGEPSTRLGRDHVASSAP